MTSARSSSAASLMFQPRPSPSARAIRRARTSAGLVGSAWEAQSNALSVPGRCSCNCLPSNGFGFGDVTATTVARKRARSRTPERGPRILVIAANHSWWQATRARSSSVTIGGSAASAAACSQQGRQWLFFNGTTRAHPTQTAARWRRRKS